jgi:phosphoglycolate phosphatase
MTTLTRPYPGAQQMLQFLRGRGLKLGVCTNKPARWTHIILRKLKLDPYFIRVLGSDSLAFRKPDPRVLWNLLTSLHSDPGSSDFVGDSEVDATTAAAAGVPFILMTHGYLRGPAHKIQCLAAFDHFKHLTEFIGGSDQFPAP